MTRFQKLLVILATAFLAVMVYDRIRSYRRDVATREAIRDKAMWNDYERCVDALPYPPRAGDEDRRLWLRARTNCLTLLGASPEEIGKQPDSIGFGK
jgi:hypothetical protein